MKCSKSPIAYKSKLKRTWRRLALECKTLSDICLRICSGGTPKRSCREYYDGGTIPWLNTAEVNFNRIRSTASHITEQGLDNSSTRWVPKDTVIVAMYGATAGRVAIAGIPLTTNQACCNLVIDCALADPKYVYYWLKNRHCEIAGLANGGAQQNLSVRVLKEVEIVLPALSVQHAVADYLAVLDEKIELNSRINDHLLEMALSEYKELSRQSSSKRTLQDCTSLLCRGGAPKYCEKGKFHALNQRCIRNHKIDDANARRIENPRSREKLLRYGDILICSTGTGTLGRSAQVLCHDERVTVDSHVTIVRPAYEALVEYLGCWALSSEDQFESMAKGSTGQTELPRTELAELEIGFPDAASLNDFSGKTKPLFEAIQSNVRENQSLECLRDALLPKLMSGEIDVSRIGLRQLNGHLSES
ncbi:MULTISPECIES: restriction endonuclease subunit S [Adlercreutzia]|uniref:restriction endonuclease subunit S n=1 Tax=Adlercreutzia TaxID=447020 RepID=UPI001E4A6683|nr:restriction endonuclease subunit S [Adlercreutzia hattorii]MCQ5071397.1 restriction endonuclease subunit S [Adlercreutzia sp. DFI.6.23]